MAFNLDVPEPEYIETDDQARELLHLSMRRVEEFPGELIGFDTETHGKKLPFKVGTRKPLDWMGDTVLLWSLSFFDNDQGRYRRWCLQQQHLQYFAGLLENPNAWLTAWNAKYDGHVSWNSGINIWEANIVDGLALVGLYDENRRSNSLKKCALDYCGLKMTPYLDLFDRDAHGKKAKEFETSLLDLPLDRVSNYASYDAYACLRTAEFLRDELKEVPISREATLWDHFINIELDFTEVLWRMERRGMFIDVDYLNKQIPKIDKVIAKLEREINREVGRPLNVNAPAQLAKFFFGLKKEGGMGLVPIKMTKGGNTLPQPSTDKDVMVALAEATPVAAMIVNCRKLQKTRSTYLTTLRDMAEHFKDGRIHPSFHQFGARTGRLSTSVPNSQNFPRPDTDDWGIRKAFITRPGYKLIVADYEQLEMRILADQSEDKAMIGAIRAGKDLHSFTASHMIPGVTYEDVASAKKADSPTPAQKVFLSIRQGCKPIGFGIMYGAGPPKISESIPISEEDVDEKLKDMAPSKLKQKVKWLRKSNPLLSEEQAIDKAARHSIAADKIEAYFGVFPRVKSFIDFTHDECRERKNVDLFGDPEVKPWGFVTTMFGRYRRLEDIDHSNRMYRGHAERESVNTKIQGTAADIVKAAMLRIEHSPRLNKLGLWMLNQIHDELVFEVPEENAEAAAVLIRRYMEHPLGKGNPALCVDIPVDLKIVDRWSQAK